ncbi:FecR family protein [Pedobacter psychroterrae]|uniref:FecR family protein n=1 Tax=Pedobacter psychroterrae TaxID=2530453 RepID=A0A4R0NEL4_9SPHI|nr:FecR family protein [Pedobacter psychroterrae]TCC98147.1 FecR family protein [Pedobacter psychroterrae]
MEDFNRQEELLEKYKKGLCTPQEKAVVEHWYNTQSESALDQLPDPRYPDTKEDIWKAISSKIEEEANKDPEHPTWVINTKRILVAASIFVSVAVGVYYFAYYGGSADTAQFVAEHNPQIKPGGNKAYLTLSNGKRIVLSDSTTGTLAMQSGVKITKTSDGQIVYQVTAEADADNGKYNVLEAPKGGQYQIVLIDGTKVWLNSASVLKYPARFSAAERKVELTGEAYFEVAKDKKKPFKIITDDQEIAVLGTHFNVNAYSDESDTKTTLIEGSVKVSSLSYPSSRTADIDDVILKPGQQSVLHKGAFNVKNADTEEAIAWKNGYFIFENDNMDMIMRKLERWYDVEVAYIGAEGNRTKVMGTIDKNTDLAEVLKLLEATGKFKFKTEGRRITIMQ